MAIFVFENTSQAEAATFSNANGDFLLFSNASATARGVTVTPTSGDTLTNNGITITSGTQSLTFAAAELSPASLAGRVIFDDGSSLRLGTGGADAALTGAADGNNTADVIYGFGGADSLTGNDGADYLYGGTNADVGGVAAADTLNGGAGNDHLYGNALVTTQGQVDGGDLLNGGAGNDYLQGNAGVDTLNGDAGNDRIFGGADGDQINGGRGTDTVNGNLGNDTIDGGSGNDVLRGGQGNDSITGGATIADVVGPPAVPGEAGGNDILYGDEGNDTLVGGDGLDVLFGGNGNDIFSFSGTDASNARIGATTGSNVDVVDVIADYVDGSDEIRLGFNPVATTGVVRDTLGTTFSTLAGAQTYAQQLLDNANAVGELEVAALRVGSDTYLFYNNTGVGVIDSAIKLVGVTDPTLLTVADFTA